MDGNPIQKQNIILYLHKNSKWIKHVQNVTQKKGGRGCYNNFQIYMLENFGEIYS